MFRSLLRLYFLRKFFSGRRMGRGRRSLGCGCIGIVLVVVLLLFLLRGCGQMVGGNYQDW